ncbi:hypothetical protein N665_0663s0005 [Sinapis alba]|nr:hypothetical protein N665_0663s0005 [Sinapis alba]
MSTPSQFSSLPNDLAWQVLARVPKCKYPILACVSKNFNYLVRSPEIHKIRSLLGKDSLYIFFMDKTHRAQNPSWFTLRRTEDDPSENQFAAIDPVLPHHYALKPSIIANGPEIFFICGSVLSPSTFWVFDSRSGELRQGPSMSMPLSYKSVGLVGRKIYVVGGLRSNEHIAESFDLNTQTWETAPIPGEEMTWLSSATVSLDRKVCSLMRDGDYTVWYDTKDGSCESFALPNDKWWKTSVCVIDNVLYVYYARFGLMWYDTKLRLWRVVNDLNHLKKVRSVGMGEYYGKLALLWREYDWVFLAKKKKEYDGFSGEQKEIWCRMIALDRSEDGISGTAESPKLLGSVPRFCRLHRVLSVSD